MTKTKHHPHAEHLAAETPAWLSGVDGVAPAASLASALAGSPLFDGMSGEEVERALAAFDEVRYPSGHRIVLEGLEGSDFFVVVAGRAAVLVGGWRVAALGPGDFFGEMAILGNGLRTASVRAETPLHCVVLPNGRLDQLLLDHPRVAANLLHAVVGRWVEQSGRTQPPAVEMAGA
ncbi:MAG: cyclic nucleotide-binding domain-containing protein [Candidatus Dormibacteria bacterium]